MLFAAREAVQISLGFSPAELVFGHMPRGPLKSLQDKFLASDSSAERNVLDYISRGTVSSASGCVKQIPLPKESLSNAQAGMKRHFDRSAVPRHFQVGDDVLAFLPIPGSTLAAKFSGPYNIRECISDTDYVINTPERRRKTCMCHVNMLKRYHSRENAKTDQEKSEVVQTSVPASFALIVTENPKTIDDDDLLTRHSSHQSARLPNSEMLRVLPSQLKHLSGEQQCDITQLIHNFPCLFSDVPTRTTVLKHDIDVKDARPIKQHPYRVNPMKRELMKKEAEYLLQHGLAMTSSSPWSSPCLLEAKSDGSPRFITDFQKVNAVTVLDSYPLPRMEDCVDNLGTARYVRKLDLLKGYWQVPLTDRASKISAFVTPDHFLQYSVIAFGMCNAPATFQRLVNTVFS